LLQPCNCKPCIQDLQSLNSERATSVGADQAQFLTFVRYPSSPSSLLLPFFPSLFQGCFLLLSFFPNTSFPTRTSVTPNVLNAADKSSPKFLQAILNSCPNKGISFFMLFSNACIIYKHVRNHSLFLLWGEKTVGRERPVIQWQVHHMRKLGEVGQLDQT